MSTVLFVIIVVVCRAAADCSAPVATGDQTLPMSRTQLLRRAGRNNQYISGTSYLQADNVKRVMNVFPEAVFNYTFPLANLGKGPGNGPYSYTNFLRAVAVWPDFCNDSAVSTISLDDLCRKELVSMFAHFVQEVGAHDNSSPYASWRQGLYYYEELACAGGNGGSGCDYRGSTCDPSTPQGKKWVCPTGAQYYGRGAKQLSYNYNYGPFSQAIFGDVNVLLQNPGLVVSSDPTNGWLAFASAMWFYMTPQSPKPSMHDVVTGFWTPDAADTNAGRTAGFGVLIMIINGGLECGGSTESAQAANRISYYTSLCSYFNITSICTGKNSCTLMQAFDTNSAAYAPQYYDNQQQCQCSLVSWQTVYSIYDDPLHPNDAYTQCVNYYYPTSSCCGNTTTSGASSSPSNSPPASTSTISASSMCASTCTTCVAVPGNSQSATDANCSPCGANGQTFWPCNVAGLCQCKTNSSAPTTSAATTTTTASSPTSSSTTKPPGNVPSSSSSCGSTCGTCSAVPQNNQGATDTTCAPCGGSIGQTYWPCNVQGLCYCSIDSGTNAPTYDPQSLCASTCKRCVANPKNNVGATNNSCSPCGVNGQTWWPCNSAGACMCSDGSSSTPTTSSASATSQSTTKPSTSTIPATPVPAPGTPQPSQPIIPQRQFGNTMADFKRGEPMSCFAQASATTLATCGGYDYGQALCMSMAFYQAQAGGNSPLDWRGNCFPNDGSSVGKNLSLGWFDAGDFVKFHLPMAYSAMALAWGALEFPDGYAVGTPQRNGLLWNLRQVAFYFLASWDPNAQTLVAQVGDGNIDHSLWEPCYRRTDARPVAVLSPTCHGSEVAGDTSSALAAIAMVLKRFEGSYSTSLQNQLITASQQIYSFAKTYQGTYTDCVTNAAAFYASYSGYKDELALAATWQYALQKEFSLTTTNDYLAQAASFYSTPYNLDWDGKMLAAALLLYQYSGQSKYLTDAKARADSYLSGAKTAGGLLQVMQWGSLREASNAAFVTRLLGNWTGNAQYAAFAQKQLQYFLGSNPQQRSYQVGFGNNAPINPHHRAAHDSPTNDITNPKNNNHLLIGALVGGPYSSDSDYADDRTDYVKNEVTTDYNALFSGLLASFVNQNCVSKSAPGPTGGPVTAAPTAPPAPIVLVSSFTVKAILLQQWWLQITVDPYNVDHVDILYNGNQRRTMTGPQWGDTFTYGPHDQAVDPNSQIVVEVFATASAAPKQYVIKEGSISATATVSAATFVQTQFEQQVATALNVDQSRVGVDSTTPASSRRFRQLGSSALSVVFHVNPLPMVQYTVQAQQMRQAQGVTSQPISLAEVAQTLSLPQTQQQLASTAGVQSISNISMSTNSQLTPTPPPMIIAPKKKNKAAVIVPAVIIPIAVLSLAVLGFVIYKKKFQQQQSSSASAAQLPVKSNPYEIKNTTVPLPPASSSAVPPAPAVPKAKSAPPPSATPAPATPSVKVDSKPAVATLSVPPNTTQTPTSTAQTAPLQTDNSKKVNSNVAGNNAANSSSSSGNSGSSSSQTPLKNPILGTFGDVIEKK